MAPSFRARAAFALCMSLLMSALMSAWVTLLNLGFDAAFLTRWMRAFAAAWPAAFLIVLTAAPSVQRFSQRMLAAVERAR